MFGSSSTSAAMHVISVLFSEPKIPQRRSGDSEERLLIPFSALQRAENSSISEIDNLTRLARFVSVLFSEPKIPQFPSHSWRSTRAAVSVLFSEPKIPQKHDERRALDAAAVFQCSSASRKFLRIVDWLSNLVDYTVSVLFSEPKIPQKVCPVRRLRSLSCFSALQRAENSSETLVMPLMLIPTEFQCSSASRKFLRSRRKSRGIWTSRAVSVLFSEPKIPQNSADAFIPFHSACFSALQRAENSSEAARFQP